MPVAAERDSVVDALLSVVVDFDSVFESDEPQPQTVKSSMRPLITEYDVCVSVENFIVFVSVTLRVPEC
ncbi:hypothetical protein GCM10027341_47560 [Spirosoma knui]